MNSPNHLAKIEDLFHAALEREPAERAAFLAEACADDQSLLEAVNDLLAAHDQSWSLMDQRHAAHEIVNTSNPTRRHPKPPEPQAVQSPAPHSSGDDRRGGRFVTGQMLAGRYRIVGLLGKGGMGEVYKAEDLKLNQTVALKFLPESIALDGGMLARFHNEVRIARQVAHPNVCRVYDIGEVEGLSFLSMEFIDGEDLSSLLRRIGRLPGDKAVELARQMCAGLAAAHEAGVLHRDLKPANVMIDGRGKARITDFGLAVVSEELRGEEAMAGTPAYMAPEQLTGKEVTQRSDIYALGLVLYELFTGKRVFEAKSIQELIALHEKSMPPTPSSHVKDIDPLAERVILRCLEKDPKARPASAVQVALALPGGDPLQAALALGEMPSPEMVAAAGGNTGLRPAVAVACLLAIIIGLVAAVHFRSKARLIDVTPFEHPPEVLAGKAREIIVQLGYPERPADSAHGFEYDRQYLEYVQRQVPSGDWRQPFSQGRPAPIYFWRRESLQQLLPIAQGWLNRDSYFPKLAQVNENDPPITPGSLSVRLDTQGRLIRFVAMPAPLDEGRSHSPQPDKDNWAGLFSAAGIDAAHLAKTELNRTPPSAFDARAAWVGTFPEHPSLELRVEAAAWRGRPVYFEVIGPWAQSNRVTAIQRGNPMRDWVINIILVAIFSLGGMLAWRNWRQGRSDRNGAFCLTAFVFLAHFVAAMVGSRVIINNLTSCYFPASFTWLIYMGLEPYVRRRWPVMLISWSRLLAGRFRDPLVGRDALFGIIIGIVLDLIYVLLWNISPNTFASSQNYETLFIGLSSVRLAAGNLVYLAVHPVIGAMIWLFMLFLLRLLARRDWLAVVLFALFFAVPSYTGNWQISGRTILLNGLMAVAMTRYGLVATASALFASTTLSHFPVTLNFSVWYAGIGLAPLVAVLALAVFAFYTSLGGQKVFQGSLLDD
jgi:predicted Ser/Thr protein kinase